MRISIITPNYNQGSFLEEALASVFTAVRGLDIECIAIDGGSTDGSPAVLERYGSRLSYWCSERDGGQYDALNKGFARATGEILGWLNSDDIYFPWTLETVHAVFTALPEVDWLSTTRPGMMGEDGTWVRFRSVPGYSRAAFLDRRYIPVDDGVSYGAIQQESTFWRRSLWERAGGRLDGSFRLAGDFELWSRFFALAPLHAVDVPLAAYRVRRGQRGADSEAYMREVDRVVADPSTAARVVREAARIRALRGLVKRLPRYSAPVISVSDSGRWSVQRVRFG